MIIHENDQRGIAHLVAITFVVIVTALIGTYFLVASHADSLNSAPSIPALGATDNGSGTPVASTASKKLFLNCPGKARPVNATQADLMYMTPVGQVAAKSLYGDKNSIGYAIVCVGKTGGRKIAHYPSSKTITKFYHCDSGREFAFDLYNPNGDGYDESPWVVKTRSFGPRKQNHLGLRSDTIDTSITLYCIQHSKMGHEDHTGFLQTGHTYLWQPIVVLGQKGCNTKEKKYGACTKGWFFSYAGGSDVYHNTNRR